MGETTTQTQDPFYTVDRPLLALWAKSLDQGLEWMPLPRHLGDTAAVAEILWDRWMPESSRRTIADGLHLKDPAPGEADEVAGRLAVFLAACHDVGKASPCFAQKVPPLAARMADRGFRSKALGTSEMTQTPHSLVSCTQLSAWLRDRGLSFDAALSLAVVPGGHHGSFPPERALLAARPGVRITGKAPIWGESREALIGAAAEFAGLTGFDWSRLGAGISQPAQQLLTGFTVVADWIASDVDRFPFDGAETSRIRAWAALDELRLPPPWRAQPPVDDGSLFSSRFALPPGASPRPVQREAMRLARLVERPELILVEAPTGEGKTEAALAAAEILAGRFGAGGLEFALPTQATSDGMFGRTLEWLGRVIPEGGTASAVLSHGKAEWNDDFRSMPRIGRLAEVYDDVRPAPARAHWWLSGRKTSALADFVVGTIDQVLMAGLVSRHVCLRHLGLAGKVVILDEVHAADTYMSVYLDRVLEWCGASGVPVIALSATLPPVRRTAMIAAYGRGRGDAAAKTTARVAGETAGYPLITTSGPLAPVVVEPSGRRQRIQVDFADDDPSALAAEILAAVADGGCVAVVRDTVARAQDLFDLLEPSLGEDVVLLHSRFLAGDRLAIERRVRRLLGKDAGVDRPRRLVVVATQVIEQSLDIDFDLMITDLAPVDLVIQRAGRLHRHDRPADERPATMRRPRLVLTGLTSAPDGGAPMFPRGCQRVYGRSALLRAALVLGRHVGDRGDGLLESPGDVAGLVREAYAEDLTPPSAWSEAWQAAEKERRHRDEDLAKQAGIFCIPAPVDGPLLDFSEAPVQDDDQKARAAVRDSDDALEVVVVVRHPDGIRTVPWLEDHPDTRVDLGTEVAPDLARAIARCTVRLPAFLSAGGRELPLIDELEADGLETWQSSRWLRGVLPLVLDEGHTRALEKLGVRLVYDRRRGLIVRTEGEA